MIASLRKYIIILMHDYIVIYIHIIKNPLIQTLPYTEVGSRRVLWKTNFFRFFLLENCQFLSTSMYFSQNVINFAMYVYIFTVDIRAWRLFWDFICVHRIDISINMLAFAIFSTFENRAIAYFNVSLHKNAFLNGWQRIWMWH